MPRRRRYNRYMNSARWQRKRVAKLEQVGHRCERCKARKRLDVHHLTYERFGDELLADLQVLCRACHRRAHGKGDYGRHRPVKVIRVDPRILRERGTEEAIRLCAQASQGFSPVPRQI